MFKKLIVVAGVLIALGLTARGDFTRTQADRITGEVGRLLERNHYAQQRLDDEVASRFLMTYLDLLDYNHMILSQSDVDEFKARYGKWLDDLTEKGNSAPAFEIYERYLKRLEARQSLVAQLLGEEFDFNQDDYFELSRNKAPWPKSDGEAESLWRARIKYELLQGRLAKDKPEETRKMITKRYERLLKTMKEFDSEEILQVYLTALSHAYDPHSDYMGPTEAKNFKINNIDMKLTGIGAMLRTEDGYCKIVSVVPGGPADLSKQLKPNDRVVGVAQGEGEFVDVVEEKLSKVVEKIRGEKGTVVRLQVIPADAPDGSMRKVVTMVRDEIQLKEQLAKSRIIELPAPDGQTNRLAVVTLPQFYADCAADVNKLLRRLEREKTDGVILDLRRNGGGILAEAIELTGLFIKSGPVVQVRNFRKQTQVFGDEDDLAAYSGPLIVLVGRMSASASEIVAAALQDLGRAVVVGDQSTHGKGTVQTLVRLDPFIRTDVVADPGELKLTVQKFYRIAGGTTQRNGVTPDIILPSPLDALDIGEASLPNCLPPDTISSATYDRMSLVKSVLEGLRERSAKRVAASEEFKMLNEDVKRLQRQREEKRISLNEAKRQQEKTDLDARKLVLKEARLRQPEMTNVFELNLDIVNKDQPALLVTRSRTKESSTAALASPPPGEAQAKNGTEGPPGASAAAKATDEDPLAEEEADLRMDLQLREALSILENLIELSPSKSPRQRESLASSPDAPASRP